MQHAQFQLHADIEERHWWFVGRRRILRRLIAETLDSPHPNPLPRGEGTDFDNSPHPHPSPVPRGDGTKSLIVDIGCGTGANIAALAEEYRCVGIDTSTEAVELARQRFPQVQFIAGRAPADLGELASQADLFLLTDVLEHVADDYAMFSELFAAAKPGSHFLITVPADESLWSEHDESFGHYRRYDAARLRGVWDGLPATPLLLSYFNARLLPMIRLVRARNQRRGKTAGRAGTDFWLPSLPINALLTAIFAGEAKRLLSAMKGRQCSYPGELQSRTKQEDRHSCLSQTASLTHKMTDRNVCPPDNTVLRCGYPAGASLVAVVRREPGEVVVRRKPDGLPPDRRV